jgi:hypothetical protein
MPLKDICQGRSDSVREKHAYPSGEGLLCSGRRLAQSFITDTILAEIKARKVFQKDNPRLSNDQRGFV